MKLISQFTSDAFILSIPKYQCLPQIFSYNQQTNRLIINDKNYILQPYQVNKIAAITFNQGQFLIQDLPFVFKSSIQKVLPIVYTQKSIRIQDLNISQNYGVPKNILGITQKILPSDTVNKIKFEDFTSIASVKSSLSSKPQLQISYELQNFACKTLPFQLEHSTNIIGLEIYENLMQYQFCIPLVHWIRGNKSSFLVFKEIFIHQMGSFDNWELKISKLLRGSQRGQFLAMLPKSE
ncbi:hypothetical protein SS50377_22255 [Spironucleus salmonicida]|uniref:Uncharacterized protein n=1 Tax=Spironucleus salmonicida TaxID=348837 RepID=V6LEZ9_9EUKA|nr:hypothetical protein SS50377_22255 [Spironucleus salmonicida]|eukprot:EST42251.1 Hypothetical protein SS50377_ee023 [Spironucleus salmonicida]